ncbi:hypothetical protein ACJX0J_039528, partial [Zea mays]
LQWLLLVGQVVFVFFHKISTKIHLLKVIMEYLPSLGVSIFEFIEVWVHFLVGIFIFATYHLGNFLSHMTCIWQRIAFMHIGGLVPLDLDRVAVAVRQIKVCRDDGTSSVYMGNVLRIYIIYMPRCTNAGCMHGCRDNVDNTIKHPSSG